MKLLATTKQVRKNSVCCLENQAIFLTEQTYRQFWSPLPVCFCSLFKEIFSPSTSKVLFEWPHKQPNVLKKTRLSQSIVSQLLVNELGKEEWPKWQVWHRGRGRSKNHILRMRFFLYGSYCFVWWSFRGLTNNNVYRH